MNLSPHFTLEELTESDTALRLGIPNAPPAEVVKNLVRLAAGIETVRSLLGKPIFVSSGYRSTELNRAIGGSKKSAHITGYAADFVCPGYGDPIDIVKAIQESRIEFDQVIQEGRWVHISFAPEMRGEILTASFTPFGVVYQQGV